MPPLISTRIGAEAKCCFPFDVGRKGERDAAAAAIEGVEIPAKTEMGYEARDGGGLDFGNGDGGGGGGGAQGAEARRHVGRRVSSSVLLLLCLAEQTTNFA